ncbi:MAG: Smr/MutS family protein [Bacteroidetes bacterium]|nr:Smr/MutS family protein [Bacteroidota bacterium]
MIYPDTFEEKSGFVHIRRMLRSHCVSNMGLELADALGFMTGLEDILMHLGRVEELNRLMQAGLPFSVKDYLDVRPEFHRLRPEGTVIELEAMFALRLGLMQAREAVKFLQSDQSAAYPLLRAMVAHLYINPKLVAELSRLMDDRGDIPDHASPALAEIRADIRRKQGAMERKIRQLLGEAKQSGYTDSDAEITIRNGRMVIPVRAADKRKIKGFVHDASATGQTVFIEPTEVFDTNNEIRELEYAERREIHRILSAFTQLLRPELPMMHQIWQFLGELDLVHAKTRLMHHIQGTIPQVQAPPLIRWRQAVHPLLQLSLKEQGRQAVPLDLELDEQHRILVISGPNAGGKSVCLKTTALLQYMLQCGLPVPMHRDSQCGIFQKMFIDIGDEQSLENDLSTYSSHLRHMKTFLDHADEQSIFFIDELGTGTEPQAGGAIAEAVLSALNRKKAFGLVTTHYANLKLLADHEEGMLNGAMLFDNKHMQPLFVLQTGKPGSSFAFEIAAKTGLPEAIISHAASITGHSQLDFEQQLQQLEADKLAIAQKEKELRMADEMLNEVITKYKRLLRQLEDRKKAMLTEASREARELIDKANRKIEQTIREIRESQAEKERTKQLREQLQAFKPVIEQETAEKTGSINIAHDEQVPALSDLKAGDMVRIEEMDVTGELIQIDEDTAVVAFGGIKLRTSPDKLSPLSRREARKLAQPRRMRSSQVVADDINEKAASFNLTIDVRGKRAEEALEMVEKYLDEAMLLSIKEVSVLHGKGNGILRRVIREKLSKMPHVASFADATLETGGHGITRVRLR